MNWSISLFRVKGIEIKIHLTFFLILIWAAYRWSISTGEGLQGGIFGVVATLLLFASVTLHELGHSQQALKFNVPVHDITLMPMGGLARMEEIPENPLQEFKIAIAGPIVNFVIAGLLFGAGLLLNQQAVVSLGGLYRSMGQVSWQGLLAYLTMTNLLLGAFNLIPAFPMDGGRILRAYLAGRMEYARATQIASKVGQGLAFLMGLGGFMSGSYSLVLIAVFVWMGAGGENKEVQIKKTLGEITVQEAMAGSPQTLQANDTLSKAVDLTLTSFQSTFPVVEWDTNKMVGLLTETDLLKNLTKKGGSSPVRDAMRTSFPIAHLGERLVDIQGRMRSAHIQAIPVVDKEGQLQGMLRSEDINEAYRFANLKSWPSRAMESTHP